MKSGGAEVRVVRNDCIDAVRHSFHAAAGNVLTARLDMIGYAMFAWDLSGGMSTAITVGRGSPIARRLLPDLAQRAVRDHDLRGIAEHDAMVLLGFLPEGDPA